MSNQTNRKTLKKTGIKIYEKTERGRREQPGKIEFQGY